MQGITNIKLEFNRDQLTFTSFEMLYRYNFTNQDLLDSWDGKKITGFKVSWQVKEDKKESEKLYRFKRLSFAIFTPPPIRLEVGPLYQDTNLVNTVELAKLARENQMTRTELINEIIQKKTEMIKLADGTFEHDDVCSGGQVKPKYFDFVGVDLGLISNRMYKETTDEDIELGFEAYAAQVFCPSEETQQMFLFVDNLIKTQSPRTLIKATVNTIESEKVKENANRKRIGQFYESLDEIFKFKFGKLLLAITSTSGLKRMREKEVPYFSSYEKKLDKCLEKDKCNKIERIVDDLDKLEAETISVHPPHLVDPKTNLSNPAALIPFCAFTGNMTVLGNHIKGLSFPACQSFQPSIQGGRLCYTLDVNEVIEKQIEEENEKRKKKEERRRKKGKEIKKKGESDEDDEETAIITRSGKGQGILLVIDPGEVGQEDTEKIVDENHDLLRTEAEESEDAATVFVETLAGFSSSRAGILSMTGLKKMTGTEKFLKLKEDDRECGLEPMEDCRAQGFLEAVQEECSCVPWALKSALQNKGSYDIWTSGYCSPSASSCWEKLASERFGCRVPCSGLYADIQHTQESPLDHNIDQKIKLLATQVNSNSWETFPSFKALMSSPGVAQEKDKEKFLKLVEEYQAYKDNFAANIEFDPKLANLSAKKDYRPLQVVQIHFDSATYEEILQDAKMPLEVQLCFIGGILAILLSLYMLNGLETVYYAVKFVLAIKQAGKDVESGKNNGLVSVTNTQFRSLNNY